MTARPAPAPFIDERRHERHLVELPVWLRGDGSRVPAALHLDTRDISLGGAFVRSQVLFETGETLLLELSLPEGVTVRAEAVVVRLERGRAAGMGIAFTRLAEPERAALARFLASRATG